MVTKKELKYKEMDLSKFQETVTQISNTLDTISKIMPNIIDTEVRPFGNSSHIILPKEYAGKKAKVIIKK